MWVCGNVGNFDNVAKFVHYANNVILIAYDMMMIYDYIIINLPFLCYCMVRELASLYD
jgi:hypothetical protein